MGKRRPQLPKKKRRGQIRYQVFLLLEITIMIDLEEIGYFLFMEEQERKQNESAEEDSDEEDEDYR